jgi:hypothetical protein
MIMAYRLWARTVLVLAWAVCSCSPRPKTVVVPKTIGTVAAGYPFALQIKDGMARHAHLTTVLIDLEREEAQFHVRRISYGFATGNRRVFLIAVDNTARRAFAVLDSPNTPANPYVPAFALKPLELSIIAKEIPEVLEIARTNGLSEFCALTSPQTGRVEMSVHNSKDGPIWSVQGDGWDEKGPIADLDITIDPRTGSVPGRTLQKAVNR